MMSGTPVRPNPSVPQIRQVDGMNCIGPSAPALDGPSLAPSALSISPMAASTVQDRPGQYSAADSRYRSSQFAGRPANWLDLYRESAALYCPGLSWTVLAAIGEIESADGAND